jgi:hypothetical protein
MTLPCDSEAAGPSYDDISTTAASLGTISSGASIRHGNHIRRNRRMGISVMIGEA